MAAVSPGAGTAIVVIEDDHDIADLLDMYLRREGYRVYLASDGEAGLVAVQRHLPRLVILDVGLPGELDGLGVCRHLRESSGVAIMMLTARDTEVDRILGLEMGADDYVTKPFSPREVTARVKAILRRLDPQPTTTDLIESGPIRVNVARREVTVDGAVVALATREFDLLHFLMSNQGLALSRQQLLDGVWGADWYGDERTVDVHVRQLRRKLGDGFTLTTLWGVGYRLG